LIVWNVPRQSEITQTCLPMAKPPKLPMKERILETADRLFYTQGIRAVGVDTIAAEIGISKRTLYNHFPSKDALIVAYLQRRNLPPPESGREPIDLILGFFDRLERSFGTREFRGCPFVNAVAQLGEGEHEARAIALEFKLNRQAWFHDLLVRLGLPAPDLLAVQLAILVDGAIATNLVRGDPAMARAAKSAAVSLLSQAGVAIPDEHVMTVRQT
jgi:AcrR family transcriptional regulator